MESIIGNHCHASSSHYDEDVNPMDPYGTIFETDDLDDEYLEFQELDSEGNTKC